MKILRFMKENWFRTILLIAASFVFTFVIHINTTLASPMQPAEQHQDLEAVPDPPVLNSPTGNYEYVRPLYSWEKNSEANGYHVFVSHAAIGTMINEWVSITGICGASTCDWQADVHLRTGNHTWWVRTRTADGTSDWSTPLNFKIWNTVTPTGAVNKVYPYEDYAFDFTEFSFSWTANARASWYKVYMSDSISKLYNEYHRAADICYGVSCSLPHAVYSSLLYIPRDISDLPTGTWIHWDVMPVNVAGNGIWGGFDKFWMYPP